jgi:signal transduction histidine kinase
MSQARLIGIAGLIAWLMVGVPAFIYHAGTPPSDIRWTAAFLTFGVLFAAALRRPRPLLLLGESAAAIALVLLRCNGYEGTLLALVAMQLGTRFDRRTGIVWIGVQTLLLGAAVAIQLNLRAAFLLVPPYLGFQLVAFFAFFIMAKETAARTALAAANAELRAVQEILADSSRLAERLRITHELHDALGHRLTALTLNLEVALQRTQGEVKASIETAQSLARQLLGDVREIVADSAASDGVQLAHALQTLVSAVPRPRVHLEVAESLGIADPERAHILLRCTQEIVTNAARHSDAENLWIVIERDGDSFRIAAHDDGRGSDDAPDGFGLRECASGWRERAASFASPRSRAADSASPRSCPFAVVRRDSRLHRRRPAADSPGDPDALGDGRRHLGSRRGGGRHRSHDARAGLAGRRPPPRHPHAAEEWNRRPSGAVGQGRASADADPHHLRRQRRGAGRHSRRRARIHAQRRLL